jgi:hypothetical protein
VCGPPTLPALTVCGPPTLPALTVCGPPTLPALAVCGPCSTCHPTQAPPAVTAPGVAHVGRTRTVATTSGAAVARASSLPTPWRASVPALTALPARTARRWVRETVCLYWVWCAWRIGKRVHEKCPFARVLPSVHTHAGKQCSTASGNGTCVDDLDCTWLGGTLTAGKCVLGRCSCFNGWQCPYCSGHGVWCTGPIVCHTQHTHTHTHHSHTSPPTHGKRAPLNSQRPAIMARRHGLHGVWWRWHL